MSREGRSWLAAILVGVAVHLDWHLGRPGHHADLSFALGQHWLLGVPVSLGLLLLLGSRLDRWVKPVAAGLLLGQGLEPLVELLFWPGHPSPFNLVRWRVFGEFILATSGTSVLVLLLVRSQYRDSSGEPST